MFGVRNVRNVNGSTIKHGLPGRWARGSLSTAGAGFSVGPGGRGLLSERTMDAEVIDDDIKNFESRNISKPISDVDGGS